MAPRPCPACGAVVSKRIGRCPSCRAWLGRRRIAAGLVAALLAVASAWTLILMRGPAWTAATRVTVRISPAISLRSPDERGTDALATINNPNLMPVDVTIRVRGYDITDRPVIEKTIDPFHLPAGGTRDIQAYLDATPLQSVTFEPIAVNPIESDRP